MWNVVGHEWAVRLLAGSIAKGSASHAYLLTGPAHIGKTTVAQELAKALNCTGSNPPCGECSACRKIAAGTHPDARLISGEEKAIGIDQVREIQREVVLRPFEGRYRVHILSHFQGATPEAANCLLKTLEEPPQYEVLILTAIEPSLLLPTVVSRCQVLPLRLVPIPRIREALENQPDVDTSQANLLARLSGGRVGWAMAAAKNAAALKARGERLDQLLSLLSVQGVHRWTHVRQLSASSSELKDTLDLWSTWWRDVLLLKAGCRDRVTNLDRQAGLAEAVTLYNQQETLVALQSTRTAREQLEHNVNARLALEVLLLEYPFRRAAK
jgi:DNA polymerase-3 subunit delta'